MVGARGVAADVSSRPQSRPAPVTRRLPLRWGDLEPDWLREGTKYYLSLQLESGQITWSTVMQHHVLVARFAAFLHERGFEHPALATEPSALRAVALDFAAFLHRWQRLGRSGLPSRPSPDHPHHEAHPSMSPTRPHTAPDGASEPTTPQEPRTQALRRAARGKREAATTRAERAIRELATTHQEINFRSVARAGGISLDFLYANPDLRSRIETLRAQQATSPASPAPAPAGEPTPSSIATTLTAKLHQERAAHRTAVTDLEHRLAAAHGELLRLRRILDQHDIDH